jgi:hypothetical protein
MAAAERDLEAHDRQAEQAAEVEEFLTSRKYSQKELYAWMENELATLYFQCSQIHHAHCDADARLAGLVGRDEVARAEQVVAGEVIVNCWASGTEKVTCTAKSDWYLPGNTRSAIWLKICASLAACASPHYDRRLRIEAKRTLYC